MRFRTFLAATTATLALAGGARAYDGGSGAALSYTWTGLYGGITAGYGYGNSDWKFSNGSSSSSRPDGGLVGLTAGYNAQLDPNWVLGLEASVDATDVSDTTGCTGGAGYTCRTRVYSTGDISARLGYVIGRGLIFVKAGPAFEDTTHSYRSFPENAYDIRDKDQVSYGGLIGIGAEYGLTNYLTTKIEYNYSYFGSDSYAVAPGLSERDRVPISIVKVGLNLKFSE